jgi:hypothetical protein
MISATLMNYESEATRLCSGSVDTLKLLVKRYHLRLHWYHLRLSR